MLLLFPLKPGHNRYILLYRHMGKQADLLNNVSNIASELNRIKAANILAFN